MRAPRALVTGVRLGTDGAGGDGRRSVKDNGADCALYMKNAVANLVACSAIGGDGADKGGGGTVIAEDVYLTDGGGGSVAAKVGINADNPALVFLREEVARPCEAYHAHKAPHRPRRGNERGYKIHGLCHLDNGKDERARYNCREKHHFYYKINAARACRCLVSLLTVHNTYSFLFFVLTLRGYTIKSLPSFFSFSGG